jgi:hypothetical protein
MAETAVKQKYNALLFDLSAPVSRDSIPAVAAQPDPRFGAAVTEQQLPQLLEGAHQPVPPLAAPQQKEYVGAVGREAKRRKCANEQFGCKEFADVCQGYRPELCKGYLDGRVVLRGTKEDQEELRREAQNTKKGQGLLKQGDRRNWSTSKQWMRMNRLLMSRTLNIYNCMCSHIRT